MRVQIEPGSVVVAHVNADFLRNPEVFCNQFALHPQDAHVTMRKKPEGHFSVAKTERVSYCQIIQGVDFGRGTKMGVNSGAFVAKVLAQRQWSRLRAARGRQPRRLPLDELLGRSRPVRRRLTSARRLPEGGGRPGVGEARSQEPEGPFFWLLAPNFWLHTLSGSKGLVGRPTPRLLTPDFQLQLPRASPIRPPPPPPPPHYSPHPSPRSIPQ